MFIFVVSIMPRWVNNQGKTVALEIIRISIFYTNCNFLGYMFLEGYHPDYALNYCNGNLYGDSGFNSGTIVVAANQSVHS